MDDVHASVCRERRTNTRACICAVNIRVITYNESVKMAINDASVERTWKAKTKSIDEIELEEMYNSFRRNREIQYLEAGRGL